MQNSTISLDEKATHAREKALQELERLRSEGEALLPVKISARYKKLLQNEREALGREDGPLHCVAYPKQERLETFVAGEVQNFVMDTEHMPAGLENILVHRYPAKALFLATCECLGHCQYCFRPDIAGKDHNSNTVSDNLSQDKIQNVVTYLKKNPQIQEIIFSGGDPLVCPIEKLENAVQQFLSVPSVKYCRLHTRAPAYATHTLSDRFISMVEKHDIKVVFHLVHPYELDAEAALPIRKMRRKGIMMYNQFPLIRGVNDHPAVIMELGYRCVEAGVQPLSLFIADPIKYGAVYRTRLQRVFDIADEVFFNAEAWISNIRVCQDTEIGKVQREHISSHNQEKDQYTFTRQGRSITYQDIPKALDQPTSLQQLLYQGSKHLYLELWPDKFSHPNSADS